jgi:hypothetical protein
MVVAARTARPRRRRRGRPTAREPRAVRDQLLGAARDLLGRFLEMYMRTAAANPWVPALLIREVLPAEGAFRQTSCRRSSSRWPRDFGG